MTGAPAGAPGEGWRSSSFGRGRIRTRAAPDRCVAAVALYPAMTSRCIQSSNTLGSIDGVASSAYWLAPKTPGR